MPRPPANKLDKKRAEWLRAQKALREESVRRRQAAKGDKNAPPKGDKNAPPKGASHGRLAQSEQVAYLRAAMAKNIVRNNVEALRRQLDSEFAARAMKAADEKGLTLLMLAAAQKESDCVIALLDGSDVDAQDDEGETALRKCVQVERHVETKGRPRKALIALAARSRLDIRAKNGESILMSAAGGWSAATFGLLAQAVERGAGSPLRAGNPLEAHDELKFELHEKTPELDAQTARQMLAEAFVFAKEVRVLALNRLISWASIEDLEKKSRALSASQAAFARQQQRLLACAMEAAVLESGLAPTVGSVERPSSGASEETNPESRRAKSRRL